ncbi:MAG: lipid A biosynthesis acyltransferase [Methylophilaceae bacterium]
MIQKALLHFFSFFLSKLSLNLVHIIGIFIGKVYFLFSKRSYKFLRDNMKNSKIFHHSSFEDAVKENINELGKGIIESFYLWSNSQEQSLKLIRNVIGEKNLIHAEKRGKGIIFLTPHLGCFEITSIYYGSKKPITVMYRKARKIWMSDFMINGRKKGKVKLAPADIKGLKKVLIALKNGEAVGILPDQVADKGEGELANFFGRPAYTMVLISKLIKRTDAAIIMAYGERLKNGNGFNIHVEELKRKDIETTNDLNKQVENFIKKNPTQYYWSYDRYKSVRK